MDTHRSGSNPILISKLLARKPSIITRSWSLKVVKIRVDRLGRFVDGTANELVEPPFSPLAQNLEPQIIFLYLVGA